ncbi:MAG: hypothetical protein ACRDRA_21030 [Pseudonocardiaceae bacterium]
MVVSADSTSTNRPSAVRLIFEYDGDDARLVFQQRVDVAVTGFDIALTSSPGHYVEVRTSEGRALTRVPVRGGFSTSAEAFGEPERPIAGVDLKRPISACTVVVPAREAAARVSLLRVESEPVSSVVGEPAPASGSGQRTVELLDAELES